MHVTVLLLLAGLAGCTRSQPPALALEECDPGGYIGCIQPSAYVFVPIADSNLFLSYSSRWAQPAKAGQPGWSAASLGLGGWSINLVQRYDIANQVLIGGDATWRRAESVALPSGERAVPSYDGALAYIFDSAGRHLRTVDARLGTELVTITYDSAGRLQQVNGSANGQPAHVFVQRDGSGAPQALIGLDGGRTELARDGQGRLIAITNPAGETTAVSWNAAGLVESETDPAGGITRFTYDESGQLASLTDADGVTQRFERKSSSGSLEISAFSPSGRHWTYRVESPGGGIRRTLIRPDGTQDTETTDAHGSRTLKLADGTSWSIGALANPVWGVASPILTPVVETRPDGVVSRRDLKYGLQSQRGLPYLLAGSVTAIINGQPWTQRFDPTQHVAELADPTGRRTIVRYDGSGRVLSYSAPGVAPVSYSYDAQGRRASETVGKGKLARTTTYSYDPGTGQMITTRPDGIIEKTGVNKAGRIVRAAAGDGGTVILGYDASGRVNQVQPPGGVNFTLGMSPAGRATAFVPPMLDGDASVEMRSYNKDGQLTAISGPGNRAIAYGYDSAGRVTSSTFDQGKRTFSYDSRSGFLVQAADPSGINTTYRYTDSVPTELGWSGPISGSVAVKLDANGRGERESLNGARELDFGYDAAGFLTAVGPLSLSRDPASGLVTHTALGVVATKQEFDGNGQLIREMVTAAAKTALDRRYTRDDLGRIKSVAETTAEGKTANTEYFYDRADRLVSVRVNGRIAESYAYDPAGNRLSISRTGENLRAAYDDRDRPVRFGRVQYRWMPDGTLAGLAEGQGATAFVYDDFGALRQASLADGRKIQYLVDAAGRRVGREVAGKLVAGYLYRTDGFLVAESGKVISRFAYDNVGHLALLERGGVAYRVITDQVGSPRMILDSRTGALVEQLAYDAWGNVTQDTAPGFIPIGFAGGLRDPDTGLIWFGARDYDPTIGRWAASDPIRFAGGQANLCAYVHNDPVNWRDPSGLCGAWMAGLTLGFSGINGIGPEGGLNLQYIQGDNSGLFGSGFNLYQYIGGGVGNDTGVSLTGNVGYINNPSANPSQDWTGATDSFNVGAGPLSGGIYGSPNGSYLGASFGVGASLTPATVSFNRTYTKCLTCGSGPGDGNGNGGGPCNNPPDPPGPGGSGPGGSGPGGSGPGGSGPGGNGPGGGGPGGGGPGGNGPGGGGPGGGGPGGGGPGGPGGPGGAGPGGGHGEPHLDSVTGVHFDFQAAGEFLVAASPDGKYLIQVRQQPWGDLVAVNTALAAGVDGDRVGVYAREPSFLLVNGAPVKELDVEKRLAHGGWLERHGGSVSIRWREGGSLEVTQVFDSLNYTFVPSAEEAEKLSGLLGRADGSGHEIAARDGALLGRSDPDFAAKLHDQVGNSWRLKPSESLFHYWPGESTAKFTDLSFPHKHAATDSLSSPVRSKAEAICRAVGVRRQPVLDDCILDVGLSGMPAFATASVGIPENRPGGFGGGGAAASAASASPSAPAPDQFAIRIGDTVAPDRPARGAGIISHGGEKQVYSFSGQAGGIVYVKVGPCDGTPPILELRRADETSLGGNSGCADFGPVTLPGAAVYHIVASAAGPAAHYSFTLRPAAVDQYSIRIGDSVSPDHPAKGAGIIKDLGEKQSYSFSGHAGEAIYIALGPCDGAHPSFELRAPDDKYLAGVIGNCNADIGRVALPATGAYRIVALTDKSNVASRYNFWVHAVPPDRHFPVRLPFTVAPGVPARGAGHVTAAGEQQFYDFTANPGTTVHIEGKCGGSCPKLGIRATRDSDTSDYGFWDLNFTHGDWTLPAGGKYTIEVRSNRYTGDYSFTASVGQPQRH
jgi:RHS repeat-associated protein